MATRLRPAGVVQATANAWCRLGWRAAGLAALIAAAPALAQQALPAPLADPRAIDFNVDPVLRFIASGSAADDSRLRVAAAVARHPAQAEAAAGTDVARAQRREARAAQLEAPGGKFCSAQHGQWRSSACARRHVRQCRSTVAPLVDVVPKGSALAIAARVRPSDIGFVHRGQPVAVRITTYFSSVHGTLKGRVTRISPDAIADERGGEGWYEVRVRVPAACFGGAERPQSRHRQRHGGRSVPARRAANRAVMPAHPATKLHEDAFGEH